MKVCSVTLLTCPVLVLRTLTEMSSMTLASKSKIIKIKQRLPIIPSNTYALIEYCKLEEWMCVGGRILSLGKVLTSN